MHADIPATIPRILARAAQLFGDSAAISEERAALSFRELEARAHSASAAFIAGGIKPGDRIAIWAPNGALWVIAALGALGAGALIVPLNTRLKGKEAALILRRSGARLLLTVGAFLGTRYPQLLAHEPLPQLERLLLLGTPAPAAGAPPTSTWEAFLAGGAAVSAAAAPAAQGRGDPGTLW